MNQPWTPHDGVTNRGSARSHSHWTILPARERFPDFARAWDALNKRLYDGHPFLDSCFVGPCVRHFATASDVLAVNGSSQQPAGMILLTRTRPGVARTFLPAQAQIAPMLIPSSDLANVLLHDLPGYSLWLDFLCQDPDYSCFSTGRPDTICDRLEHTVTTRVRLHGEFDDYWAARSKNLRQNIRKYHRRVAKDGTELRLQVVTDPKELESALRRFGELEIRSWKGAAGSAIHWQNAQGHFYNDVLQAFASKDRAAIYELYCNDTLAAALMTMANESMIVLLKTTYDASLAEYSPGWLVIYELLKKEFLEKRFGTVEFYTNATPIMLSWATDKRVIEHITMYRASWCRHAAMLGRFGRNILGRLGDMTSRSENRSGRHF